MAERTVRSPLPGTFYRRPSPDADPFVQEGDAVSPGDVVGVVEVMKTYYEVKADQAGVVDRFLIENEDPIDAGQDILALRDAEFRLANGGTSSTASVKRGSSCHAQYMSWIRCVTGPMRPSPQRLPVHRSDEEDAAGRAGAEHLVRVAQVVHGDVADLGRDAELARDVEHREPGDPLEHVRRRGLAGRRRGRRRR